jgi:cytoskeleton protein RodZ
MPDMNDVAAEEPRIDEEPPAAPEPPGRRLREAREAREMSREEAARALRLNVRLIQALEEDDFERLPPAAFVTGYLRSYARVLELPAEEIVGGFAQRQTPEPPQIVSNLRHGEQVRSSDLPVRLITYLIILGLAGLLASWWFSQRGQSLLSDKRAESPTQSAPQEPPAVVGEDGTLRLKLPDRSNGPAATAKETPVPEAAKPLDAPVETTTEAEPTVSTTGAEAAATAPAVDEPAVAPEPPATDESNAADEGAPARPETTSTQAPPPAIPALRPGDPQATLTLDFSSDCWMEIHDADGRRLAYRLGEKGDTVTLHGQAPFNVFLGYAPGVTVRYNGEVFDQSPYRHRDMARFHVGKAEDNAPLNGQE